MLVLLLLAIPLLQGCFICTDGKGPVQQDTRTPGTFSSIELDLNADLTVRRGSDYSVKIEAEENLLKLITTGTSGDELKIDSRRCLNAHQRIRIAVTIPALESVELNGSGKILIPDTFQVKNLRLEVNGSGTVDARLIAAAVDCRINGSGNASFEGSANKLSVRINGSGNVHAYKMPCNDSEIRVNGSGDVKSYAIQNLDVHVNGSGSVFYKGKPSVNSRINGSGKVVDEN